MKILSPGSAPILPELAATDRQLADDLTLRGIAVEGVFDLGAGNGGSLFEMDITTNRVDAMNHYGIAREAAAIYDLPLAPLDTTLPASRSPAPAIPRPHRSPRSLRPLHRPHPAQRHHRPLAPASSPSASPCSARS